MEEIELKFLEIDIQALEKKLIDLGAEKVGEYFYKRSLFDFPDMRLDNAGKMIRVRDEGDKVTMSSKGILNFTNHEEVTKDAIVIENEIIVSDFQIAREILFSMGLVEKRYQENRRIRYTLNGVEVDLDSWPKIPPYAEIEGPSLELVEETAKMLGFNVSEAVRYPAGTIYKRHYGINLHEYARYTFDEQIKK